MGNDSKKTGERYTAQDRQIAGQQYNPLNTASTNAYTGSINRDVAMRSDIYGGYTDLLNRARSGYPGPTNTASGDSGGGGGSAPGAPGSGIGDYLGFFNNAMNTGAFNRGNVEPYLSALGNTGRFNELRDAARNYGGADVGTVRGILQGLAGERFDPTKLNESYGGWRDFRDTSGFAPGEESNLYRRGASASSAAYGANRRALEAAAARSNSPFALASLQAKNARLGSQGAADSAVNTAAQITAAKQANRQAGLAGMLQAANAFGTIEQENLKNRLGAGSALGGFETDLGNMRIAGLGTAGQLENTALLGATNAATDIERAIQSGRFQGAGALQQESLSRDAMAASSGASAAARDLAERQWLSDLELSALGGARQLYGTAPGEAGTFGNLAYGGASDYLGSLRGSSANQTNLASIQNPWMGLLGQGVGAAAGALTGGLMGMGNRPSYGGGFQWEPNNYWGGLNQLPGQQVNPFGSYR